MSINGKVTRTGIVGLIIGQCIAAVAFIIPVHLALQYFLYAVFTGINIFYFVNFILKEED